MAKPPQKDPPTPKDQAQPPPERSVRMPEEVPPWEDQPVTQLLRAASAEPTADSDKPSGRCRQCGNPFALVGADIRKGCFETEALRAGLTGSFLAVLKITVPGRPLQVAFFHWQLTGSTGAGSIFPCCFFELAARWQH